MPCLVRGSFDDGQVPRPGHPLLDDYLGMVAARARPNTVLATAFDLKVFFSVVGKQPEEIRDADVLAFIRTQRQPRRGATVVRIEDGEAGLSARTIKRRLASVTGLSSIWSSVVLSRKTWCPMDCLPAARTVADVGCR
jgi:integrase/recombinase XerD